MTSNTAMAIKVSGVQWGAASQQAPARAGLQPRQAETASPVMLGYYVIAAEEKRTISKLRARKHHFLSLLTYLRKELQC